MESLSAKDRIKNFPLFLTSATGEVALGSTVPLTDLPTIAVSIVAGIAGHRWS